MVSYGLSLSLFIIGKFCFFFLSWFFSVLVLILVLFLIASFPVAFWIKCPALNVFYTFLVNTVSWVYTSESWGIFPVVNVSEWDSGISSGSVSVVAQTGVLYSFQFIFLGFLQTPASIPKDDSWPGQPLPAGMWLPCLERAFCRDGVFGCCWVLISWMVKEQWKLLALYVFR